MEANDAADEAFEDFLATPPTTIAGLRAALEYVVEIDEWLHAGQRRAHRRDVATIAGVRGRLQLEAAMLARLK